jgi:hypothetical protein
MLVASFNELSLPKSSCKDEMVLRPQQLLKIVVGLCYSSAGC